jgi:protein O-GlcNAc transferase
MPWLPRGEVAGFLDEMDVYLDCPAFSGYNTVH